jgi:HD-like signal output (HDOD) protein
MSAQTLDTDQLLSGIRIPPAPFILQRLHEELQKDEPALTDIANIISRDVGISALVLRTVNSPFFGLRAKINSIQHATSLLGIGYTTNIVASLALRQAFEQSGQANPNNFWDSPSNVAMVAADIARLFREVPPDEAYMLGLFHNAGHALLVQRFEDYRGFLDAHINHPDEFITAAEDRRYNTQHATVGYMLARSWGLEPHMARVIRDHHNAPERLAESGPGTHDEDSILCVLKLAEHVDKLHWGMDPDHEWEKIGEAVLDHLGMSGPDFEELRADMLDKLNSGLTF